MNRKGIDYGVLARDVEIQQADLREPPAARQGDAGRGRAEDEQHPRRRRRGAAARARSPQKRQQPAAGLFGGAILAVGLVFFFEYLDSRIKTPEEISVHLGLPFLGLLPALRQGDGRRDPLLNAGVPAEFHRELPDDPDQRALLVRRGGRRDRWWSRAPGPARARRWSRATSRRAGAGRPARAADRRGHAQAAGARGVRARAGARAVERARRQRQGQRGVVKTDVAGLWVLPAGTDPPNPAELLGSQRFRDFVGSLEAALRLGHHRHAAGHGGDRPVWSSPLRHGCRVRRRRGDDEPACGPGALQQLEQGRAQVSAPCSTGSTWRRTGITTPGTTGASTRLLLRRAVLVEHTFPDIR